MADSHTTEARKKISTVHSKDTMHCLLMTLQEIKILLPNTAVAEVIDHVSPEPVENAPDWLLGTISWRDVSVPLLSFEMISGLGNQQQNTSGRIAVLNTLNGNPDLPYIALLIQGIPQLRLVQEANIIVTEADRETDLVAASMDFFGESVLIPDLDRLEQRLLEVEM